MDQDAVVRQALEIVRSRVERNGVPAWHPADLIRHAYLELADEKNEVLIGYWLDNKNRLLGFDRLACGAENRLSFSPYHAARCAIAKAASGAMFLHNHPDCTAAEPSTSDKSAADSLNRLLAAAGILVIGHYVLGGTEAREIMSGRAFAITVGDEYSGRRCPNCRHKLDENAGREEE